MKGGKQLNDPQSAQDFSEYLQEKISVENLTLKNIYNADESGIYWQTLMSCTLSQREKKIFLDERISKIV